jgi:hypothetical protein
VYLSDARCHAGSGIVRLTIITASQCADADVVIDKAYYDHVTDRLTHFPATDAIGCIFSVLSGFIRFFPRPVRARKYP